MLSRVVCDPALDTELYCVERPVKPVYPPHPARASAKRHGRRALRPKGPRAAHCGRLAACVQEQGCAGGLPGPRKEGWNCNVRLGRQALRDLQWWIDLPRQPHSSRSASYLPTRYTSY